VSSCLNLERAFLLSPVFPPITVYILSGRNAVTRIALWAPLAGMFFDFLDGKVARWRGETSMLGQELDSLADSVGAMYCLSSIRCHLRLPAYLVPLLCRATGLLRSRTRFPSIHHRLSFHARHLRTQHFYLLWHSSPSSLQRNSSINP